MDFSQYQKHIDLILEDTVGQKSIHENDWKTVINHIAQTIRMFDRKIGLRDLRIMVEAYLRTSYQKIYVPYSESKTNLDLNSESDPDVDLKVSISNASDLVNHRHDYSKNDYDEKKYKIRYEKIRSLKKIPQFAQKSIEWLEQRSSCLTATAVAIAIDEDPYKHPYELLLDKCNRGEPFLANKHTHHGNKYEEIANMFYSFRNNIQVAEYGLIQHPTNSFIGASPDGICEKYQSNGCSLSTLVGRLLEIKCPSVRKICTDGELDGEICPHYYYVQVQTQLYVVDLDECDFLQCKIEEYESWADYLADTHQTLPGLSQKTNLERGCLIQLLPKEHMNGDPTVCLYNAKYIYPPRLHMNPIEIQEWLAKELLNYPNNTLSKECVIDRVIYWRFAQIACNLIKSERSWFESKIPLLSQFWSYVMFYREHSSKLDSLITYAEEIGKDNSDLIFQKVHTDYLSKNPDCQAEPLYQTPTSWRIKYRNKAKSYQNYQRYLKSKNSNNS